MIEQTELIFNPYGFTYYKITNFENIDFGSHDPSRSHDLRSVNWPLSQKPLEIERNGENFKPNGFTTYEITTFENIDYGSHDPSKSHDPSRSHDLRNVNWPLSRKPLEIEQNGANFRTL